MEGYPTCIAKYTSVKGSNNSSIGGTCITIWTSNGPFQKLSRAMLVMSFGSVGTCTTIITDADMHILELISITIL